MDAVLLRAQNKETFLFIFIPGIYGQMDGWPTFMLLLSLLVTESPAQHQVVQSSLSRVEPGDQVSSKHEGLTMIEFCVLTNY